jgi:hypothetical protein
VSVAIEKGVARARLATIEHIHAHLIPLYFDPVPSIYTLRRWLDAARIRSSKRNPRARRGGGPIYWVVDEVEKWARARAGV